MGFGIGSNCFSSQSSPLYVSQFPFSSSVSCCSCSQTVSLQTRRNASEVAKRKTCLKNEDGFLRRRAILFMGLSVFPLLQLKAQAFDASVSGQGKSGIKAPEENQDVELAFQTGTPSNPFLSLLNLLGIFSSGVLGSLYALAQKELMTADEVIESMKTELKEKESSILSMHRTFQSKLLLEQEERTKQLRKAKEDHLAFMDQLNSANITIVRLGQELRSEKRIIEELNAHISGLQIDLSKAEEDKHMLEAKLKESAKSIELLQERVSLLGIALKDKDNDIQKVSSSLAEKEVELKNLLTSYENIKGELGVSHLEVQGLKDELLKNKKELELKVSMVDGLNERVTSLVLEKDDYKRNLDNLQEEYDYLKFSTDEKASSYAELLAEREHGIHKLQEKLGIALKEVTGNQTTISDLTRERDGLTKKLELESSNVQTVKNELEIAHEALSESRNQASDLTKQLEESKNLCIVLQSEVSRLQADYNVVINLLQQKYEEAKQNGEILAMELAGTTELLTKRNGELQVASNELAAAIESSDSLQRELVDTHQKAETIGQDLVKEKELVSSLNKKIQTLEKQNQKDKEARSSLETDLETAIKSLDGMNRNTMILSKELEKVNSNVSNLEVEREVLYKNLSEQTKASTEAKENLEDAHNIVMKLGMERDSFEKKAKKLEGELASAKGEILRLMSKMNNSSNVVVNNERPPNAEAETEAVAEGKGKGRGKVTVTVKKSVRRRKSGSQSDKEVY